MGFKSVDIDTSPVVNKLTQVKKVAKDTVGEIGELGKQMQTSLDLGPLIDKVQSILNTVDTRFRQLNTTLDNMKVPRIIEHLDSIEDHVKSISGAADALKGALESDKKAFDFEKQFKALQKLSKAFEDTKNSAKDLDQAGKSDQKFNLKGMISSINSLSGAAEVLNNNLNE